MPEGQLVVRVLVSPRCGLTGRVTSSEREISRTTHSFSTITHMRTPPSLCGSKGGLGRRPAEGKWSERPQTVPKQRISRE